MDLMAFVRLRYRKLVPLLFLWAVIATILAFYRSPTNCPWKWHGGTPLFKGSCWCGADDYCMCTPSLAIDAVIEVVDSKSKNPRIVLVRRRDPPRDYYATPGGFVEIGESVEAAARREVKEETNLDVVQLEQLKVYSDPARDKRRHTVSVAFRCVVRDIADIKSGDDAKAVELVDLRHIHELDMAFDHKTIVTDYMRKYYPELLES